jgi:predicted metal-dependent hydrolase
VQGLQPSLPFDAPQPPIPQQETDRHVVSAGRGGDDHGVLVSDAPEATVSPVFVRHRRARRYVIRVLSNGCVRVTVPRGGSRREAQAFYDERRAWVDAQRQRIAELRSTLPPDLSDAEQLALRAKARVELPARLERLAAQVGLTVKRVTIRSQQHRWGSCSSSGRICLNWRLVTMPEWVRDYVMYHELMHLRRMDHSPAFWRLVAEVCPRYQEARRWLRRHAHAPHAGDDHALADLD